jgi:hypothetical protein
MNNAITARLSSLSIAEIADIAAKMANTVSDEATIVLDAALSVLETKMTEADFVRFCEKL